MKLSNRVAIVTGAARGIGKAIAVVLAQNGSDVVVADLNIKKAQETADEISKSGRRALPVQVDISSGRQVSDMVNKTLENFGKIDILVNNAGIIELMSIFDITEKQWDRIMSVNLKGNFLCSRAVLDAMAKSRSGKIINIASDAGKTGSTLPAAHYAASKAGIICLTKSLARELAPLGIRVNAVSPGLIETDMTGDIITQREAKIPVGRVGKPEDVAGAVLFLASDDADYITGEILDVNGGLIMD